MQKTMLFIFNRALHWFTYYLVMDSGTLRDENSSLYICVIYSRNEAYMSYFIFPEE